jgi:dTDP-4-dehydrorhamnose reductase
MRVLIMGCGGMLGHKLLGVLAERFETWGTVRAVSGALQRAPGFRPDRVIAGVNADAFDSIVRTFAQVRPDVVVNCIGIIKQRPEAKDPVHSLRTNALFPHQLHQLCLAAGSRLIHISTDCVFSGRKGRYLETDDPDATDLYGRSKLLGEVTEGGGLTLRTSIIGRELSSANGLLEWFLSNRGRTVRGFARAVFSGLPTVVLAELIGDIVEHHAALSGLYHVGADPIDKYELLRLFDRAFETGIEIQRDDSVAVDRSLDSSRFRQQTGFVPKDWPALVARMAEDDRRAANVEKQ